MVESQVFWAESIYHWSDAIKSVVESQTTRFGIGRLAAFYLYKILMASDASAIDPVLYEKLAILMAELYPEKTGLHRARFDLRHPVHPSTARFLKLLEIDVDCDHHLERWFKPKTTAAGFNLGFERVPHLSSGGGPYKKFKSEARNTPFQPPIPRAPTPAEVSAGREIDADDNVIVSPAAQRYWEQTLRV